MIQLPSNFFEQAVQGNPAELPLRITSLIESIVADQYFAVSCRLDLDEFEERGHCRRFLLESPISHSTLYWGGESQDHLYKHFEQGVWQVQWNESTLTIIEVSWESGCGTDQKIWVIADTKEIAESFILDVHRKTHVPKDAILVFSQGSWMSSRQLYQSIQNSSFDDLVLSNNLKDFLREDFRAFLNAKDKYQRLGVSWRRGAIFIGPPGNGKTHCVRALIKELNIPCLYVQSVQVEGFSTSQMWKRVFDRARGLSPCVLVLEDLDSLVDATSRSFFLNQLDGFEKNEGMIVLATTNYPERIDAGIINRPSRFDRKYNFLSPGVEGRAYFLSQWQRKLEEETGWLPEHVSIIANATDGFSFAYLKELVVSSVLQWLSSPDHSFVDVAVNQAVLLSQQMVTSPSSELTQDADSQRIALDDDCSE